MSTNLAIACQGGGSHTAFTAGVLKRVLPELDGYDLVGLSGTSGGALSAAVAWYGLLTEGPDAAVENLDALWDDLAANDLADRWLNDWTVWNSRIRTSGFPLPELSPSDNPFTRTGQRQFRALIESHLDFDSFASLVGPETPRLVVGTVDINGGAFETFVDDEITADALLASAAIPELFPAVEIHGHWHWDGLFSQNPPIQDLMTVRADRKPEELWVVQTNLQQRSGEPRSLEEIADRRNELSGNISLNQELSFIERVNDWVAAGHLPEAEYTHTEVRRVALGREYSCSSKYDRRPAFVDELLTLGETRADEFLSTLDR